MQSLVWGRSADQDTTLPEEGDLSEGRGGGALPLPCHLTGPGPTLPHPGLPARMEHRILVTGGFGAACENTSFIAKTYYVKYTRILLMV